MENIKLFITNTNIKTEDFNEYINLIDEKRKEKTLKIKNIHKKNSSLISSLYLRKYIKNYYIDKSGKLLSPDVSFNISDSFEYVIFGIGKEDIGVDIEHVTDVSSKLLNYTLSTQELKYFKENNDFFKMWTSKESLVKCNSIGLNKIKDIPALPINGKKEYLNKTYYSKCFEYKDYIISITSTDEFNIEIIEQSIDELV